MTSNITDDVVVGEITAWQTQPLDSFYAIVCSVGLMIHVRDGSDRGRLASQDASESPPAAAAAGSATGS